MWLSSMLRDGVDGSVSSKRVITLVAFILCSIAFIANLFFGYKIDPFIYETMAYIAMAGLGVTVAEKFSSRYQNNQQINNLQYKPYGTPLPPQKDPLI